VQRVYRGREFSIRHKVTCNSKASHQSHMHAVNVYIHNVAEAQQVQSSCPCVSLVLSAELQLGQQI
jgi:hypothetical protein